MATVTTPQREAAAETRKLVEMSWDPITRIVGSLGIYAKIDFANRQIAECHSTSSLFRGYSIFMKGKDPRDAHFITSRICGICGDNHATCACYAQQMAFGVRPPAMAEWIVNLGEAAEYMFDHNIFQDNLVGVDFCELMVKETNPKVWDKAQRTPAPHANLHHYKTIADIMTSLNPFTGEFYREALVMSRLTREMFCLMEGRHVHPSTLYPGGVGTVPTQQLFTDYLVRLMKYVEFMKKVVPLHDDLFDFFYEALPGYEQVGYRRTLLGCWGSWNDPEVCDYKYENMNEWGKAMYVTPGVIVDGQTVTNNLVDINLGIRILLGSSFYEDWDDKEMFVKTDPLGNPVDRRHPWNQTTTPKPQKRNFEGNYTWVMSPRWLDLRTGDHLALDTGGGADRPAVVHGAGGPGGHRLRQGDRAQRQDLSAQDDDAAGGRVRVEDSEVEQRHRARPGADLLPGLRGGGGPAFRREGDEGAARRPDQDVGRVQGPRQRDRLRLPRGGARRAVASRRHPRRQDRQLPPLPADAVERQPARQLRHAGAVRRRGAEHADLRGERPGQVQGHRHHAGGAQLRPVPAVRRPHVQRGRQAPRREPRADVRGAEVITSPERQRGGSVKLLAGAQGWSDEECE